MNIHDHPNTKQYLAHFLLTIRKHAVLEDTDTFDVEVQDEAELTEADLSLLR